MWGPFPDYVDETARLRENRKFLAGVPLPDDLVWTADPGEAVGGAQVVVLATPSRYFRDVVRRFKACARPDLDLLSVAKGLDPESHQRMTEVAGEILACGAVAALSGPSHAEEVARCIPTAVVIGCSDQDRAERLQTLFNRPEFRIYTSDDVVGVELGGALKNVVALAAGISDGLGYGDNTRAALITRGLAEATRLAVTLGAHPATCAGLAGVGDLIVTCTSKLSRNRAVGERLGRGEKTADILAGMDQVAEGVWTCGTARELAERAGVRAPITEEVFGVVHEGKEPRLAVRALLDRDPRPERD
jgi:glycerol-3-phosphate dehydrogenase (NAD(P)+)